MQQQADHPKGAGQPWWRQWLVPSRERRKRLLRIEAWIVVVSAYGLLAFAYVWPQDYRNTSAWYVMAAWTAFMVRVFVFHLGLVLVCVGVLAWRLRSRRMLLATIPLLLITLGPELWEYRPRSKAKVDGETVTIMTANLLARNTTTDPIIAEIKGARPDILLLQEYTDHWHDAIQEAVGPQYPHVLYFPREDSFGAALYSRRPFVEKPQLFLPIGDSGEPQIRAVVRIADRDVAVYNIHLLPPFGVEYTTGMRLQFADLLDLLEREELPVIVGGDFNFTNTTPNAVALERIGLSDAFSVGGWGRGTTWPVTGRWRWVPSVRLDHLYLGRGLTCAHCRTGVGRGSDHRPVIAEIGFARQ